MPDPKTLFSRTECGCVRCVTCCQHKPGALSPYDLEPLLRHHGVDPSDKPAVFAWAEQHLQASDGTQVLLSDRATGTARMFRLPTLVPKLWEHGCEFLTEDNRCDIHEVAPFACSHFDMHMDDAEADQRSRAVQLVLLEEWLTEGITLYQQVWNHLYRLGLVPPPLAQRQTNLLHALEQLDTQQEQP